MAWYDRLRNFFQPQKLDRDIEREMAFHMAERADELQAAGMNEKEAARTARRQFGNATFHQEEARQMNVILWLEAALRHFRVAVRSLAKAPAFTATIIVTLALGIGSNTAVFSALDAVVLSPMPYPAGERLVTLMQGDAAGRVMPISPVRIEDWNRESRSFAGISGSYTDDGSELSGELPEKVRVEHVAPRYFTVLGVAPALGRSFSREEEIFGGPAAVVLSDRYWKRRFGGQASAIGRRLRAGDQAPTIVGVMPASFRLRDAEVDLWVPVPVGAPYAQSRQSTFFDGVARLKDGVDFRQAQAELSGVQTELGRKFPETDAKIRPQMEWLKESTVGKSRQALWLLYGSVTLLLLIACANIASLLLARSTQQGPEIAVRFALGATRGSLVAQVLAESFLLAAAGALAGLGIAAGSAQAFRLLAKDFPRLDEIQLDEGTLWYTLGATVATTLLCGLVPALRATRNELRESIASAGRGQISSRRSLQWLLVGIQVALSVTLLAGAGLMIRSFQEMARISPGFDARHVMTFHLSASWGETGNYPAFVERSKKIVEQLRNTPGIEEAAIGQVPGFAAPPIEVTIAEAPARADAKLIASGRRVSPGYFAVMKIPVLSGSLCREGAGRTTAMVNRSFADKYFSGESVVGKHLGSGPQAMEIEGIVGDSREDGLTRIPMPTVYYCHTAATPGADYLVRSRTEPAAMMTSLRRRIAAIESTKSIYDLEALETRLDEYSAERRLVTVLLSFFALTAIALASIGLYGTLSYFVSLRRREIGLRLALGAARGAIVAKFLRHGVLVSALGCFAGLGLALAATKLLAGMLYGVSTSDAGTLSVVVLLVLGVTTLAALVPSMRAARLEPMAVLREE